VVGRLGTIQRREEESRNNVETMIKSASGFKTKLGDRLAHAFEHGGSRRLTQVVDYKAEADKEITKIENRIKANEVLESQKKKRDSLSKRLEETRNSRALSNFASVSQEWERQKSVVNSRLGKVSSVMDRLEEHR
jgi:flagellar biosynthesis/type III secretory pathway chaperone